MVNTELFLKILKVLLNYNILNIVVNTEPPVIGLIEIFHYNILNIVVNTEHQSSCSN